MRRNNAQDSEHVWVLKTYSDFSYAVKGKKYDKDNSMFFGTTFVHKIDEYFQQAWMENVTPDLVDDLERMEKLKKLFIYSKCVYQYTGLSYQHRHNHDGSKFRNYALVISNRRLYNI